MPGLAARQGGPSASVVRASLALRRYGCASTIFTTDLAEPASSKRHSRVVQADLPAGAEQLDVRIFPAAPPKRLAFSPKMAPALRTAVELHDVVHIHSLFLYPQFVAFRAASRAGVPFVVSPRGALEPVLRQRNRWAKELCSLLWQGRMLDQAAILHFTTAAEQALVGDLRLRAPPMIVPNGIDFDELSRFADAAGFRNRHLHQFDGPFVLALGRVSHVKGLDFLIRAFGLISGDDTWLVIAGPDDEGLEPALRAVAEREGVASRVVFIGALSEDERLAALTAATVFVLPSKTESFGNALLEAMAAGRPVVVSQQVSLASEIAQAGAGLVCERTPQAFADAMASLLDSGSRRAALGVSARAFASRYDWQVVAPKLVEMYVTAIGNGSPADGLAEAVA
ncbi:MAG: glycosyltransferase [Actinomycetota bacterium]|nr:glycosyltransferase [Actinomycetota bacterium]